MSGTVRESRDVLFMHSPELERLHFSPQFAWMAARVRTHIPTPLLSLSITVPERNLAKVPHGTLLAHFAFTCFPVITMITQPRMVTAIMR